jgi:DNA modification methylase
VRHGDADSWRSDLVLDPFAASGPTVMVALGHGRDSIGIDIDSRNADLALQPVGMWLTVEDAP